MLIKCDPQFNECNHEQNGATCENVPGAYRCHCAPNFYGIHCTENANDCSAGSNEELCGHGTCVNQGNGYKCLCEQVVIESNATGGDTGGVRPGLG